MVWWLQLGALQIQWYFGVVIIQYPSGKIRKEFTFLSVGFVILTLMSVTCDSCSTEVFGRTKETGGISVYPALPAHHFAERGTER